MRDAGRAVAARADDLDVAHVDRHRQIDDPRALRARPGALVPLGHVDTRHHDTKAALRLLDALDGAALAAILAGEDDHRVAPSHVH